MTPLPTLRCYLFGPLQIESHDGPLVLPASAIARSLLAYLILHPERPFSRDLLVGLFWPERTDAQARRALSNALWQIRDALGHDAERLTTEGDTVSFCLQPDDWIDVHIFQKLCSIPSSETLYQRTDRLRRAITLYRADFLEDVYQDWALLERERLRETYLNGLDQLITLHKRAGDFESALDHAQRLVAADPLRESAHRELMRLYHLLGRSQAALQQFARLTQLLKAELGVPPTPNSVALYQEIAAATQDLAPPHLPVTPPPPPLLCDLAHLPFVGRAQERQALLAALQTAIQGQGGLVLIEGDAGVGKTRLVSQLVADAEWRGVQVGLCKAEPLALAAPHQLLRDALSPLLTPLRVAQLAELVEPLWLSAVAPVLPTITEHLPNLPELPRLNPTPERQRLWQATVHCLAGLAAIAPLLLILEDLHWADEATLALLPYLTPRLPESQTLLVLTCRSAEARERAIVWDTLQTLDQTLPVQRLRLCPFERADATTLVQRALGASQMDAPTTTFAGRLQSETGGNPLFLVEILKSLLEQNALSPAGDDGWIFPVQDQLLPTPASVQELIGQRLVRLPSPLKQALEQVAVLGEDADFAVLSQANSLTATDLAERLEALCQWGFLLESGAGYRFEHDLVREVTYQSIPPEKARQLHHRAGTTLAKLRPERIESLARHFDRAKVRSQALTYTLKAAERAKDAYDYATALNHYERALTLAQDDAQARWQVLTQQERVLNTMGKRQIQATKLDEMARLAQDDPQRLTKVHHRQAWLMLQTGRQQEAAAAGQHALETAQRAGDESAQAKALTVLGTSLGMQGKQAQAISHGQAAAQIARRQNDLRTEARAHTLLSSIHLSINELDPARASAETALKLCQTSGDKMSQASTLSNLGRINGLEGKVHQAEDCYRRAIDICRTIGYRLEEARNLTNWALLLTDQDRIADALTRYQQALDVYRAVDHTRGEALVLGNLADIYHRVLGDDETATRQAQQALRHLQETDNPDRGYPLAVLGRIACRRGEHQKARQLLTESLTCMQKLRKRPGQVESRRALLNLCLARNAPQTALEHLEAAETICQQAGLDTLYVNLLADRAAIMLALQQPEAALEGVAQALDRLKPGVEQAYRIPFVHYRALTALRQNQPARAAIDQAYQMLSEMLQELSPEQQKSSLERVPLHRAIVAAWQEIKKQTSEKIVQVQLPHVDAPTGRPLRADEWVQVRWTLSAPQDDTIPNQVELRRQRILRLLAEAAEQSAAPTVQALAQALDVSQRTVKRDLAALRQAGHETPTRGSR